LLLQNSQLYNVIYGVNSLKIGRILFLNNVLRCMFLGPENCVT
jgi:hypothetical protein